MEYLPMKHGKIAYTDTGTGNCLVLLHGFTEDSRIWNRFVKILSDSFRVVTVDLPGFGGSDYLARIHTMELNALAVLKVLDHLGIRKCVIAGHSMGGYTALAFARKYPRRLSGLCLFHSHPFADTPEGLKNRERAIEVIRADKGSFLLQFIPSLFPEGSLSRYAAGINTLIRRARSLTRESLLAASYGMKMRRDHTMMLKELKIQVLYIIGLKDKRFPVERLEELLYLAPQTEALILRDVGHMGFMEEESATLKALRSFVEKC